MTKGADDQTRAEAGAGAGWHGPEAVVAADHLTVAEKRQVLARWHAEVSAAEGAHQPDLMTRIARSLAFLDADSGDSDDLMVDGERQ